jgi:hypothetical protein
MRSSRRSSARRGWGAGGVEGEVTGGDEESEEDGSVMTSAFREKFG